MNKQALSALSVVEGPALSVVEGPALSIVEGRAVGWGFADPSIPAAGARYVAFPVSVVMVPGPTGATGRTKISMS
jgi:hypothetical protein